MCGRRLTGGYFFENRFSLSRRAKGELSAKPERRKNMAWVLSTVQSISLEKGAPELPGFFVGQSSSSAELTLVFEDVTTAEECANAMKRILDKAVGIRGPA
jgi:hypothetical protein